MQKIQIDQTSAGQRLDTLTLLKLPGLSRASVQKLIEQGQVYVNGQKQKSGYKLKVADELTIDYDQQKQFSLPLIDLPIIYEDENCIVLDKPIGILTHSKGAFNPEPTVATFIANKLVGLKGDRAGIVHRLDRATSGVMICAKNEASLKWLQKQFSQRKVKKTYLAVCKNRPEHDKAVIDMPIERNPKKPQTFRVGANGKSAITNYEIMKSNGNYSLIKINPLTGRTHQIRVHLKNINCPIIGDDLYGGLINKRLMLHAESLEITLLNHERKTFISKPPNEFNDLMRNL